ncbi:MAG: hypothetical protein LBH47_03100, partial [Christensenellaceae bacterium]|nr:hypothetical protein [Christensenellaceae bacterium]
MMKTRELIEGIRNELLKLGREMLELVSHQLNKRLPGEAFLAKILAPYLNENFGDERVTLKDMGDNLYNMGRDMADPIAECYDNDAKQEINDLGQKAEAGIEIDKIGLTPFKLLKELLPEKLHLFQDIGQMIGQCQADLFDEEDAVKLADTTNKLYNTRLPVED